MKKEMISAGKFKELDRLVFEQRVSTEGTKTYAICLGDEDELMVVNSVLSGNKEALSFLQKYQQHYPLGNKAVVALIKGITENGDVKNFMKQEFKLYGYNQEQAVEVLKLHDNLDTEFLLTFAMSGRVYYENVDAAMRMIGSGKDGFSKVYEDAVKERRNS